MGDLCVCPLTPQKQNSLLNVGSYQNSPLFLIEMLAALKGHFPLYQEGWILSSESTLSAGTSLTALEMKIPFSAE